MYPLYQIYIPINTGSKKKLPLSISTEISVNSRNLWYNWGRNITNWEKPSFWCFDGSFALHIRTWFSALAHWPVIKETHQSSKMAIWKWNLCTIFEKLHPSRDHPSLPPSFVISPFPNHVFPHFPATVAPLLHHYYRQGPFAPYFPISHQ